MLIASKVDTIIREFVADGGDLREWTPRYSIAPTQVTPIVRQRANPDRGVPAHRGRRNLGIPPGVHEGLEATEFQHQD